MPLILAIEPDPRQAAQIATIARHRVGAELMLAGTTEQALDVIGDRVPDLVLVPALLSPQDDAALAAALRVIAAAAHVRTLTIPVLATGPKKRARVEGMLAKWRRGKDDGSQAPDGCDPAIFAEQISAYLREAAAERAALAALEPDYESGLADEVPAAVAVADVEAEFAIEPEPEVVAEAAPESPALYVEDEELPVFPVFEPQYSAPERQPLFADTETPIAAEEPMWAEFDLAEGLGTNGDASLQTESGASTPIEDAPASFFVEDPAAAIRERVTQEIEPQVQATAEPMFANADEDNATIAEIFAALRTVDRFVVKEQRAAAPAPKPHVELWMPLSLSGGFSWPRLEGVAAEFIDPREQARQAAAERAARAAHKAEPAKPEWSALIASLRKDIERLRGENQTSKPAAAATATAPRAAKPVPVAARPNADAAPRPKPRAPKPAQDEWGFFDPEQCGFAALLAKLNEITEPTDEPDARAH